MANQQHGGADNDTARRGREKWSRRRFLVRASQLSALTVAGPGLLAACGGGGRPAVGGGTNSAGGGAPVRGGTFMVGMVGTGAAETVNPMVAVSMADNARICALFDRLFEVGPDVKTLVPRLATEAEPDKRAKAWTFRLRDGVTWHDGKPFTADDVIYSLRLLGTPENYGSGTVAGLVDFGGIRKRDPLTVEVPLRAAHTQFPALLTGANCVMVQSGAKAGDLASRPVGTGAFRFESFTPGKRSVFNANKNYWDEGKPYVDSLVIDSSFSDVVAQVNALRSGQINVLPQVPYAQVASLESSGMAKIIRSAGVAVQYFKLRVDTEPFKDRRVRRAFQMVADRKGLIEGALAGHGTVVHDILAPQTLHYADGLKRERDPDRARALLKQAGVADLQVSLLTYNSFPGALEAATLFARQAKDAGIKVTVDNKSAAAAASLYMKAPFANAYTLAFPTLDAAYRNLMSAKAVYPETGWGDTQRDVAVMSAVAQTNPDKARSMWHDIQQDWFDGGPYVAWGAADNIDAVGSKVRGLRVTSAGNLDNFRFQEGWLIA